MEIIGKKFSQFVHYIVLVDLSLQVFLKGGVGISRKNHQLYTSQRQVV